MASNDEEKKERREGGEGWRIMEAEERGWFVRADWRPVIRTRENVSVIPVKLVKRDPWVRFLLVGSRPECRTRHPPSPDVDTNRRIEVNRARSRSGPFMQIKMFPAGKHGGFWNFFFVLFRSCPENLNFGKSDVKKWRLDEVSKNVSWYGWKLGRDV